MLLPVAALNAWANLPGSTPTAAAISCGERLRSRLFSTYSRILSSKYFGNPPTLFLVHVTLLTLALGSSLVKTDYEAERLAQPKRPTLKLAFRLCLGPYRHLAQFVFYPNCKHAHV